MLSIIPVHNVMMRDMYGGDDIEEAIESPVLCCFPSFTPIHFKHLNQLHSVSVHRPGREGRGVKEAQRADMRPSASWHESYWRHCPFLLTRYQKKNSWNDHWI